MSEIVVFYADDWETWYVDGKLWHNHHPVDTYDILELTHNMNTFSYVIIYYGDFIIDREVAYTFTNHATVSNTLEEFVARLSDDELVTLSDLVNANWKEVGGL